MSFTSVLTGEARGAFHELRVLKDGTMQDVLTLLSSSGYTDQEIDTMLANLVTSPTLSTILTNYVTSSALATSLSGYYTASQVGILLSGKVSSVTAGSGISITGISTAPIISADEQLALRMDGAAQSGVHTLDFLAHSFSLDSGTLTIGTPDFQSRLSLFFASSPTALWTASASVSSSISRV